MVGITRFELVTSPLSGVRSNRLSYTPFDTPIYEFVNLSNLNKFSTKTLEGFFICVLLGSPSQTNGWDNIL